MGGNRAVFESYRHRVSRERSVEDLLQKLVECHSHGFILHYMVSAGKVTSRLKLL